MAAKKKASKDNPKVGAKPQPPAKEEGYGGVVIFEFIGNEGEHIVGLPARNITLEEYDRLEGDFKAKTGPKWDLHLNADSEQPLYRRLMKVSEARKAQAKVDADAQKVATKAAKSVKTSQPDPDARVPNRTDSDVVAPGMAVPQTDEPIAEGAPGFVQSDTGGPQAPG